MYFVRTYCVGQFEQQLIGPFATSIEAKTWAAARPSLAIAVHDTCPVEVAASWEHIEVLPV